MPLTLYCPHCSTELTLGLIALKTNGQRAATPASASTSRARPKPKSLPPEALGELPMLFDSIDEAKLDRPAAEFIRKMKASYLQYKEKTFVSEAQMAWIRDISNGKNDKDNWE